MPIGCLKEPYELKKCPESIDDLDWPENLKKKEDQSLFEWGSQVNSADWPICHVRVTHRIPVVICDHLFKGIHMQFFTYDFYHGVILQLQESHACFMLRSSNQAVRLG